jgi:tetratricopeptide (TPR) repeat protein
MLKILPIILSFALLLLIGCGAVQNQDKENVASQMVGTEKREVLNQQEKQNQLVEAFKVLDERMKKMVETAKEGGKEAIEFLASDLFLKANDSSMRGDSHTAAYLYKQLLDLKPNDNYVKKKYAVELIRLGSLVEAKLVLGDILKETSYSEETLGLILGGVHTALNETEEAQLVYKNVLKKHPASEEACVFLAKSYTLEKKYKKAHSLLKSCAKKEGKPIFTYYQAKVFLRQKQPKAAERLLKLTLKKDPSYYQAAMALGLLKEEKENIKGAVKVYEDFLKKNPRSFPVISRLVQVLFANEMFEKVLPYAEQLSSLDQSDLNLRVRLGILYTDAKMYDKAIGVFKEILAAVPSSDKVLYYLGSLYQQTSDFEKALDSFNKISEESSLYVDSSMQIAQLLQSLVQSNDKKWSGKYKDFLTQRGGTVEALKIEFQMMLATYFEGLKDYSRAIASIEKVRHQGDYSEGHDYYLASLYEKVDDFRKARNIVQEILDKNPKNAHALNFLGYSMLENDEDLKKAYSLIRKAIELKPNDGYIRDSLGWYYYKTGQVDKALKELTRAFELVESDVVIAKHLAIIYRDLKKYDKAKKFFVEALKNCKLESERRDVLKELGGLQEERLPASSSAP